MSKTTLVLIAGFIAGCGAAVVAPLVIPPAHAQTTQRWEVHCVFLPQTISENRQLAGLNDAGNAAGREGWELVTVDRGGSSTMCFKRPAP